MRELRFDPLRNRWVIVVPERARRPSDYLVQESSERIRGPLACPFCLGNEDKTPPEIFAIRDRGSLPNMLGWRVRVVPNKFPALRIEDSAIRYGVGVFDVVSGAGAHEVIIETPDHHSTLADLPVDWIRVVLVTFRERILDLKRDARLRYVLVFKNHQLAAGASLEHTHSQLIATPMVPPTIKEELTVCRQHFRLKERCLICDVIGQERRLAERIIHETSDFLIWAPFASSFPFEMIVLPKNHLHDYSRLSDAELAALAQVLKAGLLGLKELLNDPPYNLVLHTAPPPFKRAGYSDHWSSIEYDYHWHIEIIPRLTRIAGFEWGAGLFINPTPPEVAAEYLRQKIEDRVVVPEPAV
ncbi:MAG: galactose-1-phosphate uridylyltransferase [Acidobacteria bacterium]|nr:galactose-1-phosphate uridylyltransferase [Acidobacteriota bacterium]